MSKCDFCEKELEDIESRYLDKDGEPVCEDCWREYCTYACAICEEAEDIDRYGEIGGVMIISEEEEVRDTGGKHMDVGLYLILDWPLYFSDMLSFNLCRDNFRKIADLPEDFETFGYPTGFLCRDCAEKAKRKEILWRRFR
jgi:hypothetical protein